METLVMIAAIIAAGLIGYILREWRELDDIEEHYDALLWLLEQNKASMEFVRGADWALERRLHRREGTE